MAVIENLKNFIRHGKQANAISPQQQQPSQQPPADQTPAAKHRQHPVSRGSDPGARHAQTPSSQQSSRRDYDEAVARLVAEEKAQKGKLPHYPGLERWRLLEKMGDGAFSNVFKAEHRDTGQRAAIKVVRKYELSSSQKSHLHEDVKHQHKTVERASILKEVQIMRQLDHPNIVKLLDFSETRDYYYLVLELLEGGELFHQIVRLTYFSEDLSRHVIIQVAEALRYLHEEKGVVHRDIKPENLLFVPIPFEPSKNLKIRAGEEPDKVDEGEFNAGVGSGCIGQIKVADFGLSKIVWDSVTMTPCGTVGYTAPEIVKDERYSKSVDMWALGCVLYTMLCGFPPFYDESIPVLTEKVAKGQYTFLAPWWDEISKSAQDLISHLLTVDPRQRYSIDEFMMHPWIRQSNSPTLPATDAPPTGTKIVTTDPMALDTPDTPNRRTDFRSPGVVSLREVFDVSYAVHRMEEEGQRRKQKASLHILNEDMEEGDDEAVRDVETNLRNTSIHEAPSAGTSDKKRRTDTGRRRGFELNLDNATLLGRRNKKAVPGPVA